MSKKFNIKILNGTFSVCKFKNMEHFNFNVQNENFLSITKTNDEVSVICEEKLSVGAIKCEKNWKILKINSQLDFSLIGIISTITKKLAEANIPVFVISTYNTDYFLIKKDMLDETIDALNEICDFN